MSRITLPVSGMTCASCAARIERRLSKIDGVGAVAVNLATEQAEVEFAAPATINDLVGGINAAGCDVPHTQRDFAISGMTCAACVSRVERMVGKVDGVANVAVNLATETATITGPALDDDIIRAVTRAGFGATLLSRQADTSVLEEERARENRALTRDLLLAIALTLPVMVIEMGGHAIPALHHAFGGFIWRVISFALATVVLFGPGLRFWRKGIAGFRAGAPDMNGLVITGAGAAWAFSTVATFVPRLLPDGAAAVYFESAAIIVTLVLAGRWMEARAKRQTSEAIRSLMALTPPHAVRITEMGDETVPLADIRAGDLLRLRAGDRVAADGIVVSGNSHVDESMLTGESVSVAKAEGDALTGGTVNGSGMLVMRATRVGGDTVLAQILRIVQAAQGAKLPIQSVVDNITRWFVPVVMVLALLTFVTWLVLGPSLPQALVHAVAVLIIACPCAMGLATPVSIMVGTGRAAELGVLFRNGAALQALAGVRTLAFDKTGTLTIGRPAVTAEHIVQGFDRDDVLRLAAAVEAGAQHPLAAALRDAAPDDLPPVTGFDTATGKGVTGQVAGQLVAVGSADHLTLLGIDLAPVTAARAAVDDAGQTPVYIAIDGQVAGLLGISDTIRSEAPAMAKALHDMGITVAMISGDSPDVAARVGQAIGITQVFGGVLPAGKARKLQELAGPVAFVGDGINDAPALAAADIGIAIGAGTAVAVDSADVVLAGENLLALVQAVGLARATLRNIHQNLFWAFAYNAALIPVAAGILVPLWGISLSPVLAAGAMALSSVFVLGNALRLRKWRDSRG